MWNFIKRLFVWWNGATLGTQFQIWRKGEKVGEDEFGNRYFEQKKGSYDGRKRRWVMYKGYADASRVPPEWHGWLAHMYDDRPSETPLKTQPWEKEHRPNLTGTIHAYRPKGSLSRDGKAASTAGDYEAWSPDGS